MSVPISTAAQAYGNTARLLQAGTGKESGAVAGTSGGNGFADMLAQTVQDVVDSGNRAEQVSMDMLNGNANVVDMVTAVSESQLAVETMVTVRDRVISAYEEIMRMPI